MITSDFCKDSLRTQLSSADVLGAEIDKTRELPPEDADEEDFEIPQSAEDLLRLELFSLSLGTEEGI